MKRIAFTLTVTLIAGIFAYTVIAQPPPGRGERGDGERRGPGGPPNPILEALDTNHDREISAAEIEQAAVALKRLDKNEDGKLTPDELRPDFGGRGPGPGGPPGRGPRPDRGGDRAAGDRGGEDRLNPEAMIARILTFDKNKDGKVSAEEVPERMQGIIKRGDKNDDGSVDREELAALARQFGASDRNSRGDRGPEGGRGEGRRPDDRGRGGPDGPPDGPRGRGGPPSPEQFVEHALSFDADDDGKLDKKELAAFAEEMLRRRGGPGGRPGGRDDGDRERDRGGDRPDRPQRPEE
jgi:Ca2+-binding EF-hand superfamily protein